MATATIFTEAEIQAAATIYCEHHGVSECDITRNYEGDAVIGYRLSRDTDGRQRGDDEKYGSW